MPSNSLPKTGAYGWREPSGAAMLLIVATTLLCTLTALAADQPPGAGKVVDNSISNSESDIVGLAEAMPADKFDFAPSQGDFKGVRTFSQQVKHVAAVNYSVSAA